MPNSGAWRCRIHLSQAGDLQSTLAEVLLGKRASMYCVYRILTGLGCRGSEVVFGTPSEGTQYAGEV